MKIQEIQKNQSYTYDDCLTISYERLPIKFSKKTDVD